MVLHLVDSKVTFHLSAHTLILPRSLFRLAATEVVSSEVLIGEKSVKSSAYRNSSFSQMFTRSSMKTENKSGPRIDPCGTEALMEAMLDAWPARTTLIDLSDK